MSAAPPPDRAARVVAGRRQRRRPVRRNIELQTTGVDMPAQAKRYWATLVEFMEYKNGCTYPLDRSEFSFEELNSIKPDDVYKWMANKCYGTPNPGPEDLPQYARANSLTYYKKAISYFMPNKGSAWTVTGEGEGFGNPTRSIEVNNLIKAVRKKETRGCGVSSSADRPFTRGEFIQAIELLGSSGSSQLESLRYQAMMKFQNHFIARSDDTAHVKKDSLVQSEQFPEFLTAKLRWCKNVNEERDCPQQIILGSMNAKMCAVLGLAVFLEKWCGEGGSSSQWLFADGTSDKGDPLEDQDKEALKCKNNYARNLAKVLKMTAFLRSQAAGKLGTHSIRKFSATTCRAQGASKDDTDYRARWKTKRMQDRYTDTQLYWPDIKAASKLCDGGVCVYRIKEGLALTKEYIGCRIVPNIDNVFGPKVAQILGKALLWACYDPEASSMVPADIRNRALMLMDRLGLDLEEGENPIKKLEVIASQEDGTISLDAVDHEEGQDPEVDQEGNPVGAATAIGRLSTQWRAAIYAKVSSTASRVTTMEQVQAAKFSALERENKQLKEMLKTLLTAPARIVHHHGGQGSDRTSRSQQLPPLTIRHGAGTQASTGPPATLCRNPQTLETLWDEYENGVGGRKPARDFTEKERGKNKFGYCRRLGFWVCMERLIRRGCTVPTAIARIKRVYSGPEYDTITKILRGIKRDEKNHGHHELR